MIDLPRSCHLSPRKRCCLCILTSVVVITGFVITVLMHRSVHNNGSLRIHKHSNNNNHNCRNKLLRQEIKLASISIPLLIRVYVNNSMTALLVLTREEYNGGMSVPKFFLGEISVAKLIPNTIILMLNEFTDVLCL